MSNEQQNGGPPKGDNGQQPDGPGSKAPPPPRLSRSLVSWAMICLVLIVLWGLISGQGRGNEIESWADFIKRGESKQFQDGRVTIEDSRIVAIIAEDGGGAIDFEPGSLVYFSADGQNRDWYIGQLTDAGIDHKAETGHGLWLTLLVSYAPFIILILLVWFFIARSVRAGGGGPGGMLGSFGKSRHRVSSKDTISVTFDDVAGIQEAKDEVHEIIEFLKNPKRFQRLGGRIPRGVLLVGPPGCGKTLLAKAIAGEADVPFFSISGSDFVEMFVGVGASRVRDLFKQAKDEAPCIIFLDEIDAVGRKRGSGFSSGGHDEREQTLNAILVEMDGFEPSDQVIVVAATNRADVLDPALTRPGRFDRQVHVVLPDLDGRKAILEVHSRKIKLGPNVNLGRVARGTPMFSGADLEALINEAAILATMADKEFVEQSDLDEARDKIRWGRAHKSRKVQELERIATAYHESGHAVVQMLVPSADPVHKVTIIPRGQSGGATFSLPERDRYFFNRRFIESTLRVLCAGRIAEKRKTGDVSSGAAMDIRMATEYARHMVLEWGMSERLGFIKYGPDESRESLISERDYSPETARIIDEEVKRLVDSAYHDAERLVEENWQKIVDVAEALLKYETLQGDELATIMRGETIERSTVSDLLDAEAEATPDVPPAEPNPDDAGEAAGGAIPSPA